MKKMVLIALLVLLALRGAIWIAEELGRRSAVARVEQATQGPTPPPIAAPVAAPAAVAPPAQTPTSPSTTSGLVDPLFDLPFQAISDFLRTSPNASLEDIVALLNGKLRGQVGVPMSFYIEAKNAVDSLTLPDGRRMRMPAPNPNACKKPEYLLGVESLGEKQIQLALVGNHVGVKMPDGYAPGKLTSMKDGVELASIYGPVARPPIAVSEDGKQFFYFLFLPTMDPIGPWWNSQKDNFKGFAWPTPFLVYSISDKGLEFHAEPPLYQNSNFMPLYKDSPKDSAKLTLLYARGMTVVSENVCVDSSPESKPGTPVPADARPLRDIMIFPKFDSQSFTKAQELKLPTLLVFTKPDCPTCQIQVPSLKTVLGAPEFKELKVFQINFVTQPELNERFKVKGQNTLVLFKAAKELGRNQGLVEHERIRSFLKEATQ